MNDLEAVRRLAIEPTDESVTRTWYKITKLSVRKAPRRRFTPAVAGLAVVALFAASFVVYRTGEGTLWPASSTPEAVALLNSMADVAAGEAPVTVAKGQLVRTESGGVAGACQRTECQLVWQLHVQFYDPHAGMLAIATEGVDSGETTAVGVRRPTLEWLGSLPSDPRPLLTALREAVGHNDNWSVDSQLWDAMAQVYAYCEIALTPSQRSALLRALAGVSGLSVRDLVIGGVALVAIRQSDKKRGVEIIFDPATGHAVGRASVYLPDDFTIRQMPEGPQVEKGVLSQSTWEQTLT
jgi:hypothetical protein